MKFIEIEKNIKNSFSATNVWIPIYQNNYEDLECYNQCSYFMTFSENIETTLSTNNWEASFGTYYAKRKEEFGGPKYFLTIERHGNKHLNKIEIAEDFRLFFNLFEINNEFYIGDYEVEPEKVIRYDAKHEKYEIKYTYLLEYISYKNIYAVLNFEIDYYHNDVAIKNKKSKSKFLNYDKRTHFQEKYLYKEQFKCLTRYLGKVSLYPSDLKNNKEKSVKFIKGVTKSGNYKFATIKGYTTSEDCNICFSRYVLEKYYNNPENYKVSYSSVKCNDFWTLDGINRESFREIIISTHNLKNMPLKEQIHWSKHSKLQEDTDYKTCEIHEPNSLITNLNNLKYYWNKNGNTVELFKTLSRDNKYKENQVYVPISNEISEFNNIIQNICICIIETLNISILREETDIQNISKDKDGKIINNTRTALKDFFNSKGLNFDTEDEFLKYLIALRNNSSHLKSRDYIEAKEYFEIDVVGTQQCVINITKKLNKILINIALLLGISLRRYY